MSEGRFDFWVCRWVVNGQVCGHENARSDFMCQGCGNARADGALAKKNGRYVAMWEGEETGFGKWIWY